MTALWEVQGASLVGHSRNKSHGCTHLDPLHVAISF